MNTTTRHRLICVALATLGLIGAVAQAQNTPATAPKANTTTVERPDAGNAQPATPQVEAPADQPARDGDNSPGATGDSSADADAPIVWTRDRTPFRRSNFRNNNDEIVSFAGNSTLAAGQRADAVVSIFGSSTSEGDVQDAIVSVFGSTRVEGGSVGDAAVAVLGDNYVNAVVDGDVVAVLGDVELGPNAKVRGNVVVVGGQFKRDSAAEVRGGVQHVMSLPKSAVSGLRSWLENCARYLRPLAFAPGLGWAWTIALGFLGLYALLAVLFREPIGRCVKTLEEQPGQTIVASLLTMLLTPVLFVVLCITIIGIAFVPIVSFGMFLATLFGKAVVLTWIGRSILRLFQQDEEKLNAGIAVLLGGAVILLLYVVPVLGFLVYNLLGLLGLGVVAYTLLQVQRGRRRSEPAPAPGARVGGGGGVGGVGAGAAGASGAPMGGGPAGAAPYTAGFSGNSTTQDTASATAAAAADAGIAGTSTAGGASGGDFGAGAGSAVSGNYGGSATGGATSSGFGGGGAGAVPPNPSADALSLPRAGFWIRMLALLIDAILVGAVFSALDHHHQLQLIALAAYGAIMWKLKGTTVGGIVCNLKVVRLDGRPIDWPTAVVRALGCFLSLVVCGLGFIWIAFDENRQSWHDKIAGTVVVRVPQGVSLL